MKDIYILGIETSCDETSVSIVKNGEEEISTVVLSQIDIHKKFGGVVPEIASRSHVENITIVIEEAITKSGMKIEDMDAIAVTYGPGLAGSLIVGVETAKTLAMIYHKPLIAVHHIAGHIYANRLVSPLNFPLIALVISGGHTEIVYMEKDYSFKKIGGTLDDSVGETYDKVARVMNVPYPGGPVLDKYAKMGKHTYNLPVPMDDDSYDFSFSGIKSAVINLVHNEKQRGNEVNVYDLDGNIIIGMKATIKDRYFNSACATPASVFPILFKLENSHIKKLEREKGSGSKIFYEKIIGNLMEKLVLFPRSLSLEEQGKFMLGYYHQTQKKYEKKENK